jgi:hypothetical protein
LYGSQDNKVIDRNEGNHSKERKYQVCSHQR